MVLGWACMIDAVLGDEFLFVFAAFKGVNQILQRNTRADKNGRAAHDFGIGVNNAFQIFDCHNMAKITPAGEIVTCKHGRSACASHIATRTALGSERVWRRIQRRSGRTIQFPGGTKLGCRNGAANWAEWSGVPFGRAGCFALGGRLNQIVSFAGVHPVLLGLLKLENSMSKQVQHPSVRRLHCGRKKATSRTTFVASAVFGC